MIFTSNALWATDYYVDAENGNNTNNGISPSTAWRTVARVNDAMEMFLPGDNIFFRSGHTWNDANLTITCSGSQTGGYITFGAYETSNKPNFSGISIISSSAINYVKVENFYIHDTPETSIVFNRNLKNHITVSNCDVEDSATNGIYVDKINTYIIENCTVINCLNAGIVIYGSATDKITNGIVRNCDVIGAHSNEDGITFHKDASFNDIGPNHLLENCTATNCGEQGFDFSSADHVIIRNCTAFSQTGAIGSISFGWAQRVYIENFFSYNERDEGIVWAQKAGSQYLVVSQSIFYNNGGESIYLGDYGFDDVYILNNTFVALSLKPSSRPSFIVSKIPTISSGLNCCVKALCKSLCNCSSRIPPGQNTSRNPDS